MSKNYRVLVVDDSPFIFKAVSRVLEPKGFEMVGHALNGKLGLEMYEQHKPDIVIMDITMPEMDGVEAASNLLRNNSNTKILMLSAIGDGDVIHNLKEAGVKHFLQKPFKEDMLIDKVSTILEI